jgi:hypothetical protein
VAELVDALDSKSRSQKECPFDPDRGHQHQKGAVRGGCAFFFMHASFQPLRFRSIWRALARWLRCSAMDARTGKTGDSHAHDVEALEIKRVRLLASLTLMAGVGLLISLPFALRAGAEFFLPVTAALVVAIALVPMLEWFERRGVPSKIAALLCVLVFLAIAIFALAAIVYPAIDWVALIPQRIDRVRETLAPVIDVYSNLERFVEQTVSRISFEADEARTVRIETPSSLLGIITASAPHAAVQLFFALLVIYFFLAGWTGMRKRTIVSRGSFEGALTTARVIQQTVDATSTYIGTITVINVCLGALTITSPTSGQLWRRSCLRWAD